MQLECQITRFGAGEALMVVRDITRIHKLEEMRKDFVANVTHELRTPLTVIRGYLETLQDTNDTVFKTDERWGKALTQMQQQAMRMTTLLNDLTMLSKLETDRIEPCQQPVLLRPLLQMVCSDIRKANNNQHSIHLQCRETITLLGNDRELYSCFFQLNYQCGEIFRTRQAYYRRCQPRRTGRFNIERH